MIDGDHRQMLPECALKYSVQEEYSAQKLRDKSNFNIGHTHTSNNTADDSEVSVIRRCAWHPRDSFLKSPPSYIPRRC